jgi:hypothetical protein
VIVAAEFTVSRLSVLNAGSAIATRVDRVVRVEASVTQEFLACQMLRVASGVAVVSCHSDCVGNTVKRRCLKKLICSDCSHGTL